MEQDLIKKNIENIKNASLPQLLAGGFQIFLTRLLVIGPVVAIVNLPIAIYYALFRTELALPVEIVEATGEIIVHEELISQFYTDWMIDLSIGLYSLIAVLAVAFVVELTIHGEYPQLNSVISHALTRWWDGLRTGAIKAAMLIAIFIIVSIVGGIVVMMLGAVLPEMVAFSLGAIVILVLLLLPLLAMAGLFFFDLYACSLREVGGWKALFYSMRISRKHWLKVLGGLAFVFVVINFPLFIFRSALLALEPEADPVFTVLIDLTFSVLSSFSIVVYTLYFLHFDFRAEPEETTETFKNEK